MNKLVQQAAHEAAKNTNVNLMVIDHKFVEEFAKNFLEKVLSEVHDEIQYETDFDVADKIINYTREKFTV